MAAPSNVETITRTRDSDGEINSIGEVKDGKKEGHSTEEFYANSGNEDGAHGRTSRSANREAANDRDQELGRASALGFEDKCNHPASLSRTEHHDRHSLIRSQRSRRLEYG